MTYYLAHNRGGGKIIFQRTELGVYGLAFDELGWFKNIELSLANATIISECSVLSILKPFDDDADYIDVLFNDKRKCYTGISRVPRNVGSTVRGQLLRTPLYRIHFDENGTQYIQLIYPLQVDAHVGGFNDVVKEIKVG